MSGLDFATVPVVFYKGLDTRSQRKLVVAGKWDTLINVSLSQDGSLKRRDGFIQQTTQQGNGLLTRGDELLIVNKGDLISVASGILSTTKQRPGQVPFVDVDKMEVLSNDTSNDMQDMDAGDSGGDIFACYVWRSRSTGAAAATGLFVSVIERSTGAKMMSNQSLIASATATSPRVVYTNGAFFIFYIDGTNLYCRVIDASAPSTLGTQTALVTSADLSYKNFDACATLHAAGVSVAYMLAAPNATSVQGIRVDRTGTTPSVASGPTAIITAAQVT